MILLKVKSTVRPRNLWIAAAIINAANTLHLTVDMLITSGNDSKHMAGSKHYTNEALDIRTKHLTFADRTLLIRTVQRRLGRDYQLKLESLGQPNEHLHIEFDPKG